MIRRRLLLAAALLATPGTVIASAAPAHAGQGCGFYNTCYYQFYNDANHDQVIGWIRVNCQDVTTSSGTTSNYISYWSKSCLS